jgi:UDPglucose 6-dehydrogenase
LGHTVRALDVDSARIATLKAGRAPFYEPGLDDLIRRNLERGRLTFTSDYAAALTDASFVLLAVNTPAQRNGEADLSALASAARGIAPLLPAQAVVITRSTVPVGTNAWLAQTLREQGPDATFEVVSNPEFLREGRAVDDFMRPERIVIGARRPEAAQAAASLYDGIQAPLIVSDWETAEVIKYAANAYLAASVSFINEIANICDRVGADVALVSQALALDARIGPRAYLRPGIGFGGNCLPKDLRALVHTAETHGYDARLLKSVITTNDLQPGRIVGMLEDIYPDLTGLVVTVLGISFKGGTFDTRSSPALAVIELLAARGARVRAFDPHADASAVEAVGALAELCADPHVAAERSQALLIATDHLDFTELDLARLGKVMAARVLVDGRNLMDPEAAARAGFAYVAIGRGRRSD